jgi:hypothetical protein
MTEHDEIELTTISSDEDIIVEKPEGTDNTESEQESTKDDGNETDESVVEMEYADYQGPETDPELF